MKHKFPDLIADKKRVKNFILPYCTLDANYVQ
jgi:hypothetical protein